jgi:hypothetical protein
VTQLARPPVNVHDLARAMQVNMFTPEQKQQLLNNLNIEGNLSLSLSSYFLYPTHPPSQSHTVLANSNHISQTHSPSSAHATSVSCLLSPMSSAG